MKWTIASDKALSLCRKKGHLIVGKWLEIESLQILQGFVKVLWANHAIK